MKLIVAVVRDADAGPILEGLTRAGFQATRINTVGGFLRRGNATILVGVEDEQVDPALNVMAQSAPPQSTPGASAGPAFVLGVDQFVRL